MHDEKTPAMEAPGLVEDDRKGHSLHSIDGPGTQASKGDNVVHLNGLLPARPKASEPVEPEVGPFFKLIGREATALMGIGRDQDRKPDAKPDLIVHRGNLPLTAMQLRQLLPQSEYLFTRGVPVKVTLADGFPIATPLTISLLVVEAHRLCQPIRFNDKGERVEVTLPDRVARMYLEMVGEWDLPPLEGITSAPLLSEDGSIRAIEGYDPETRLWGTGVPPLDIPERPTEAEAWSALNLLRTAFRTFPFGDAPRVLKGNVEVVDLSQPPGLDESAFLVGLMTAVCRASLWLVPGFLVTSAAISGAGTGKGLLVRAIGKIAFGIDLPAFTSGNDRHELDKRLVAKLVEAGPVLFLDNVNGVTLKSDTLASVLTERPATVRLLGETRMVPLNCATFVAVTGNGLSISEDLARRFIPCRLDAQCEDPEDRPFAPGFLDDIEDSRPTLLTAALTVWRWGRQNASRLKPGQPLGSYETWTRWVRDPLMALGCLDPVLRIKEIKAADPRRRETVEFFRVWWDHHGDHPVKAADLSEAVRVLADPHGRGRQYLVARLGKLLDTRMAGFMLTRQEAAGQWGVATYALMRTNSRPIGSREHRDHRDHRGVPTLAMALCPLCPLCP